MVVVLFDTTVSKHRMKIHSHNSKQWKRSKAEFAHYIYVELYNSKCKNTFFGNRSAEFDIKICWFYQQISCSFIFCSYNN